MGAGFAAPHRSGPGRARWRRPPPAGQPEYDPECYLCPGNARAGGVRNPAYTSTFVFDNDFAALKPDTPLDRFEQDGLLIAESEPGICRVVCFSPRHNLTIANMEASRPAHGGGHLGGAVRRTGRAGPLINYVQIFENRGAMMGASNPHPHCQIWSSHALPNEVAKEQASQIEWRETARHLPALRLRRLGESARRAHGGGERRLPDGGAVLGGVAVRDHGDPQASHAFDRCADRRGAHRRWRTS